jgi:hypothetical protein
MTGGKTKGSDYPSGGLEGVFIQGFHYSQSI